MFRDQDGRETAVPVAWDIQPNRAIPGQNRLASFAITLVDLIPWALRAWRIAQMMAELGTQGSLDQSLLERRRGVLDGVGGHQPFAELLKQLCRDFR